jgi:hypothetical protein
MASGKVASPSPLWPSKLVRFVKILGCSTSLALVTSGDHHANRWRDQIPLKFSLLTLLVIVTASAAVFAVLRLNPALATFVVFVAIAIIVRLVAGRMDGGRIREYIRGQGGELLSKKWDPFGTGWFDQSSARIYDIRYRDRQGNTRRATVKTSLFSGVYFTDDRVVYPPVPPQRDGTNLPVENKQPIAD